ncbi:hypothetical protein [Burkholderia gladioli]|uniref:hypothetical protein n=1 Tax=Burkholderia gladioli TaxID=28095 RepID=UPI00163FE102|nr:hypothetical protein [Burkholderia gladioli]
MSRFDLPTTSVSPWSAPTTPATHTAHTPPAPHPGQASSQGGNAALSGLQSRRHARAQADEAKLSPILQHVLDPSVNPYAAHPGDSHVMLNFAAPVAEPPSRTAARQFQQKFQQAALDAPGSVRASRHDLGLSEHRLTMIDIGGEGQKTEDGEELMRSGNAHAINVNAQTVGSPGEFHLQAEPGGQPQKTSHFEIPNLVRPAKSWPGPGEKAEGLLPFADGFSSVTMTEGAPVFGYHVNEMSRVTSKQGWMMLAVDESFEDRIGELAHKHNGDGTVWSFPPKDGTMNRYVIPPKAALEGGSAGDYKAMWSEASAHDAYDVAQTIALHQAGSLSLDEVRQAAPGLKDAHGEIDFSRLAAGKASVKHDEL